jgi:type 1 glutamine amidotransferase
MSKKAVKKAEAAEDAIELEVVSEDYSDSEGTAFELVEPKSKRSRVKADTRNTIKAAAEK